MANTKMGFNGQLFRGTAGADATTQITNALDINYNLEPEKGETTVRGLGATPPLKTESVVALGVTIEWTMLNKINDTNLSALLTAAYAGTPVSLRTKDYSSGKGFYGDVTLSVQHGKPLKGVQTFQFTASPTIDNDRDPTLYTT